MKKESVFSMVLAIALILALTLAFAACETGVGGSGNNKTNSGGVTISGNIVGRWQGNYEGEVIVNVATTTWSYPYDNGTYTSWNGKIATIYSSVLKAEVGTVTLNNTNPLTITLDLKAPAKYPGKYTFTKL
jgi:hypothetical protein